MMPKKKETRILVVDDAPDVLELVVFHLEKENFKVAVADTGDKALKMARSQIPSLLVLDLMLPGINGLEICRLLKQDPKTRDVPLLMLTARAAEEDRIRGLDLGARPLRAPAPGARGVRPHARRRPGRARRHAAQHRP